MGTTLTGTTPQDTYDSLIKVTDNGPLSGTAKYLSDGLGNDSVLALSTGAAGIATTTIVSGTKLTVGGPTSTLGSAGTPSVYLTNDAGASGTAQQYATLGTSSTPIATLFRGNGSSGTTANGLNIDNFGGFQVRVNQLGGSGDSINLLGGNVGIGTSSPNRKAEVSDSGGAVLGIANTGSGSGIQYGRIAMYSTAGSNTYIDYGGEIRSYSGAGVDYSDLRFYTASGSVSTEKVRILSSGGITFNGDTAAANALDDYEEGTWTMGISFGGGTTGITYNGNTGKYTKIGRQVTATGYLALSSKGSSVGGAIITGLPFTIPSGGSSYSPASLWFIRISFANQFEAYGQVNNTTIVLGETTETGTFSVLDDTNFANDSELMVSITYFV